MRKVLLSLMSAMCAVNLLCAGCIRHDLGAEAGLYEVAFILDGGGAETTRSTVVVDETILREWCLYIVDADGNVCNAVHVAGSANAAGNYTAGVYKAYALVNCGVEEDDFATEEEIKTSRRFLENESPVFLMSGSCEFSVPEDDVCSIPISRLVSKVEICKVRTEFSQYPDLNAGPFTIDSMYLINVAGESSLDGGEAFLPETWYNKHGFVSGRADELLCDAVGAAVVQGTPYAVPHYFDCYQNNSISDTYEQTWSPRHTRLVIECTIAGRKTYYPVDIVSEDGRLERNCRYLINELVITDLGADAPDAPLSTSLPYRFSAVTAPWDMNFLIDEQF